MASAQPISVLAIIGFSFRESILQVVDIWRLGEDLQNVNSFNVKTGPDAPSIWGRKTVQILASSSPTPISLAR
ncbi:MAG TPA: hypothetical protein VF352_07275 [Anaerolineales bacterium]